MFPRGRDFLVTTGEGGKLRLTWCLFYGDVDGDYQIPTGAEQELLSIWDALMQISHTRTTGAVYIYRDTYFMHPP